MSEVLYEVADHIATITLNAPERMNTISGEMLNDVSARLLEADRDRDVRCIVLTAEGDHFCTGIDRAEAMTEENIAAIAAGFDWNDEEAHSALYDAEITAKLFCTIVNRFRGLYGR